MSKMEEVRAEMVKAMKSGDKKRKDVLSLLLSALKAKYIDKREDLSETEENTIIQKEIKQAKETLETAPKDRTDIIEESRFAISVLEEFAPKEMSEAEIQKVIDGVLKELSITEPKPQDKGRIMKTLMPLVKGKADGGTVNRMVSALFQ